ncbi:MAG TPA: FkbM family methyltransferase [Steroidobacteraceae bacterium]|nr:FkbM family methyltransferase [Steroidobacteraceae bacterium]
MRSRLLKTEDYNQLAAGRDGYFLYNRNDQFIGRAIEKYGEFSGLEMDLLRQFCAPGNVVMEVGANIGAHTVGLARLVGSHGRVLAFEPQRLVFQTLCANVALNSLENVDCFWAAVGSQDGVVTVPDLNPRQEYNFGGVTLLGVQAGEQVPCLTLDRFIALPRVNVIKIDVEGMEADVLHGSEQVLRKFKPILYVENDRLEKSEALMRLIAGFGYRMYWHLPPMFNPNNFFSSSENSYGDIVSANLLCLHRDSDIRVSDFQEIVDFSFHPCRPSAPGPR